MQIRTRLTLQFLLSVNVILLVSFSLIYYSSSSYRQNEFYERLAKKSITTAEIRVNIAQVDSSLQKLIDKKQKDVLFQENIVIINEEGKGIYNNNDSIHFNINPSLIQKVREEKYITFKDKEFEILGLVYEIRNIKYVIIAGAIDKYGKSKLYNLLKTLVLLYLLISGLVALVGWVFAGKALQPISKVINEVSSISTDRLSSRLEKAPSMDEIGLLIYNFNLLLDRIEKAFNLQKVFLAGASHELKNPLTVITSQLQVSLLQERSAPEYKKTIESVLDDIKELNSLTHQLIDLTKLSYNSSEIPFKKIRLDEMVYYTQDYLIKKYLNYQVDIIVFSLPENEEMLYIMGNDTLLKSAFINLAENACKFSSNHRVEMVIDISNIKKEILFKDAGSDRAFLDKDLIFEPFFRSESSVKTKGHGVGLALVKQIILIHNGMINLKSSDETGNVFSVQF